MNPASDSDKFGENLKKDRKKNDADKKRIKEEEQKIIRLLRERKFRLRPAAMEEADKEIDEVDENLNTPKSYGNEVDENGVDEVED